MRLPPAGTRGVQMPKFAQRLFKATSFMGDLMFRTGRRVQGRPLLRLGTVGARSGEGRRTVLGWFPDEGEDAAWIIVASNGGLAGHPAWAYNLVKRPDSATVDAGDGEVPVSVEMLSGPERERVWRRIIDTSPGYGRYEEKTDREIPVFRLTPSHDDAG